MGLLVFHHFETVRFAFQNEVGLFLLVKIERIDIICINGEMGFEAERQSINFVQGHTVKE